MENVEVRKDELLEKLNANRADHRSIFEEALEGFQREAEAELKLQLDMLSKGLRRDIKVVKPVPVDHTRDYDRAIQMIEMSVSPTIALSERDFAMYVMDDWGWQGQFLSNVYGSTRASGKFGDSYAVS